MGVGKLRKKLEHISAWAMVLKEALVKLQGPYANDEECFLRVYNYKRRNIKLICVFLEGLLSRESINILPNV
jgi:hypothetical protein